MFLDAAYEVVIRSKSNDSLRTSGKKYPLALCTLQPHRILKYLLPSLFGQGSIMSISVSEEVPKEF